MFEAREESIVIDELSKLCQEVGYIHVISYFSFRDNIISAPASGVTSEDISRLHSPDRLIRSEISTLIGFMLKGSKDFSVLDPKVLKIYIERTESLLQELHHSIMLPFHKAFKEAITKQDKDINPFTQDFGLREPIFYGGDSAYDFQYLDLSVQKYQSDGEWFISKKGFSLKDIEKTIASIVEIQLEKISIFHAMEYDKEPEKLITLNVFTFNAEEVVDKTKLKKETVENILQAFDSSLYGTNEDFNTLDDFNLINAYPLISVEGGHYVLLQHYSLLEAFYETPFYWFLDDKIYRNDAMEHRGLFTEQFSMDKLQSVFGEDNVFTNVDIYQGKKKVGEIDVLVVFADRVIILQAKSKKLTIASRKGNAKAITDDFKKSVQDSYEQGKSCALYLEKAFDYRFIDGSGSELNIDRKYKEIYIFCVVSDHYPALAFQVDQFLEYEKSETIKPPFVMDIFFLDVMTEMLSTPLYFLSYASRRVKYFKKIHSQLELVVLSYHLQQNLFIEDELTMMMLDDSISSELDLSMMVRRLGVSGSSVPHGILTKHEGTPIGNLLNDMAMNEDPYSVELGFLLLYISSESSEEINTGLKKAIALSLKDGQHHDFTVGFSSPATGITIHVNNLDNDIAYKKLFEHCEYRKYREKADQWFGLCINPENRRIRFGIMSNEKWNYSKEIGKKVKDIVVSTRKKIGRNEACPCGSGKKYKKCCLK